MTTQEKTALRNRIYKLRQDSRDSYFRQYLTKLADDLDLGRAVPEAIAAELERVYVLHQERMGLAKTQATAPVPESVPAPPIDQASAGEASPGFAQAMPPNYAQAPPQAYAPVMPGNYPIAPDASEKDSSGEEAKGTEYTIGAIVLSAVGAVFILVAFIIFGINYLSDIIQGLFLYLFPLLMIPFSEFFLVRRIPRLASVLTGLGVAGLYAATVINYRYMEIFGAAVAIVVTVLIAFISMFIGFRRAREEDRSGEVLGVIATLGCYLSLLLVLETPVIFEYIAAMGLAFIAGTCGALLAKSRSNAIYNVHMCFFAIFVVVFSGMARDAGIGALYIILGFILAAAYTNIVYMRQEKTSSAMIPYGIITGIVGLFILSRTNDLMPWNQAYGQQVFIFLVVFFLVLAVSAVFYILNPDRVGRAVCYYFFMGVTALMLTVHEIDHFYIWGIFMLYIVSKCFKKIEYEAMNAIMTVFFFLAIFNAPNDLYVWILAALSLTGVFMIRRWRLFYQYAYTLFALIYIPGKMTDEHDLSYAVAALIVLVLTLVFRLVKKEAGNTVLISQIYNWSAFGILVFISMLCLFSYSFWPGLLVAVVGSVWLLVCLDEYFHIKVRHKYMFFAVYATSMALITRFPAPIISTIILMVIAFLCVFLGFRIHDRAQRLYGLVLAIFVCLKTVYDFRMVGDAQRMVLFMSVGLIAILISLIYARLEKKHLAKTAASGGLDEARDVAGVSVAQYYDASAVADAGGSEHDAGAVVSQDAADTAGAVIPQKAVDAEVQKEASS